MKTFLLFIFVTALLVPFCQGDLADDAETALNGLRSATSDNLNGGFIEHIKMSLEVDTAAFDTKESGLKLLQQKAKIIKKIRKQNKTQIDFDKIVQTAADDLKSCVDNQAEQAIDLIYEKSSGLADRTLKVIYDEEKQIVICGRSDEDCLNGVITDINDKTSGVPAVIGDEIELDRNAVEEQIDLIKACATEAIGKLQSSNSNIF